MKLLVFLIRVGVKGRKISEVGDAVGSNLEAGIVDNIIYIARFSIEINNGLLGLESSPSRTDRFRVMYSRVRLQSQ